jgi:hypothetical protein
MKIATLAYRIGSPTSRRIRMGLWPPIYENINKRFLLY